MRGDIVFFVDTDVALAPDALGQLMHVFEREPDVAAVVGSYHSTTPIPI